MTTDQQKESAAKESLKFVRDGQIVGLGTGSTATLAVQLLVNGSKPGSGLKVYLLQREPPSWQKHWGFL